MKLKESLDELYKLLADDEILMRLLHYTPEDAHDNPLDVAKDDILTSEDRWDITKGNLFSTDKRYDLDLDPIKICRICFYTGTRQPISSGYNIRNVDNPYASEQRYNFDVYVHVDIDDIDARLTDITDRLNELLHLKRVNDVGEFILDFISPISNTPDGFIGLKSVYRTVSLQESCERKWKK